MTSGAEVFATVAKAVVLFVTTNVDEVVLLSLFFANPRFPARSVVAGQFIGMAVLTALSAVAAGAAVAIPPGWTSLLGAIPLGLGLYFGVSFVRGRSSGDEEEEEEEEETKKRPGDGSQMLTVALVTIANGADNLSVYIPVFVAERRLVAVYAATFTVMTALCCYVAFKVVDNAVLGRRLQRYGHIVLPIVLIVIGLEILAGARALL